MPDSLKFQIALIDAVTKPGKEMASAVQKLKLQLSEAEKQVRATEAELAKLGKGKVVDVNQYRQLTAQLGQQKGVVAQLRGNVLGATTALKQNEAAAVASASSMAALGTAAAAAGAAVAVAAVAFGAAAVAGMSLALSASEAKNDTLDALDAFLATSEEVDYVYNSIIDMGDRVAISVSKGSEIARELAAAGNLTATQIVDSIESIGMVNSVLGDDAGKKIQSIIEGATAGGTFKISAKQLKGTGVTTEMLAKQLGVDPKTINDQLKKGTITAEKGISALTAAVNAKFAGLAGKQVLDFSSQMMRLKDNVTRLFEDVDTGGFLTALKDILSVFDSQTATGAALKEILTSVFNGLFRVVEAVAPFVKAFLKGIIIIALQVYIAFKPLIKTIREAFGGDQTANVAGFAAVFSRFGEFLAEYLPFVVSFAQAILGMLIPAFKYIWAVLDPLLSILGALTTAFASLMVPIYEFVIGLMGKFFTLGADLIGGLVNGIRSMATAPLDAVKGIASNTIGAFKNFFGIKSPSKLMAQMGGHLMTGLEQGIDKNSAAPEAALGESVAPPTPTAPPAIAPPTLGGSESNSGGRSVTLNVEAGAIVIQTSGGSQQIAEELPGLLANVFEQAMIEVGGAPLGQAA